MNVDIPYYFFKLLESDTTSFVYQGTFSDDLTDKTIRLGEYSIRRTREFTRLSKKVSFLIAECLQNVIRYEEKPKIVHQTNNRPGTFIVRNIGNSYYIISSNLIQKEKIDGLNAKLKKINSLDQEGLKNMQEKTLGDSSFSEKGGAGLGLIEMTRRSGHKLEYEFEHINFYLSNFYLLAKLKANDEINNDKDLSLHGTKDFCHKILDKNVMLLYQGDFSQQSMLPVLGMIEINLKKDRDSYISKKKIFYLLVELLQNMSKHALEKNGVRQGVLVICKKNGTYYIYSGNFVEASKVKGFKSYLEKVSTLDKKNLTVLYKKHLFDGRTRPKGGASLGLIDMLRYSTDEPVFDFREHDKESFFYSFGLSI